MKRKKILVLTGGGSGGHITPLLAVAEVLASEAPEYKLVYVGQTKDPMVAHMREEKLFSEVYTIRAGKFRRYHGEGIRQLLDIKTMLLNARDLLFVLVGFVQALLLLGKIKPSALFCKGGYVGVPLGFAAAIRRIPYVTHDSDAMPGLANRLIGKWASMHAVALPKENYAYPHHKTVTVGVPLQSKFKKVTEQLQQNAREKLGFPKTQPVVLVIGGGLGAAVINNEIMRITKHLLTNEPTLRLLHVAGQRQEAEVNDYAATLPENLRSRIRVYGFTKDVDILSAAATVVITRAGATNLAEFSLQGKPCIIIPNPKLTGGHQLKTAQAYADANAALVLAEQNIDKLEEAITLLLHNKDKQTQLSERILTFAVPQSASILARLLLTTAQKQK